MSKGSKHTPGPWYVAYDGDGCRVEFDDRKIFNTTEDTPESDADIAELKANARLIAAAPECLSALQLILNDNRLMNAMKREQARAILDAIAKATGGAE